MNRYRTPRSMPIRYWASETARRQRNFTAAWVFWLHHEPESVLRRTVLQEVGIAAVSGAYAEPAPPVSQRNAPGGGDTAEVVRLGLRGREENPHGRHLLLRR